MSIAVCTFFFVCVLSPAGCWRLARHRMTVNVEGAPMRAVSLARSERPLFRLLVLPCRSSIVTDPDGILVSIESPATVSQKIWGRSVW